MTTGAGIQLPTPVRLLGVNVHPVTRTSLIGVLASWAREDDVPTHRMHYTNAHVFNLAYEDSRFRDVLNSADLLICEGIGGKVGGLVAGVHFPEQLATMDWIDDLLARLVVDGGRLFLLGDEHGVAERCGAQMRARHEGLRIVGTHHGFFHGSSTEEAEVVRRVTEAAPDVLFVGMGNPLQEFWIERHLDELDVNLVLSLGAMFRWYAGVEYRAPRWMRDIGLEWLMRLARHPIRHFRRYVIGNPLFLWRCVLQRFGLDRPTRSPQ